MLVRRVALENIRSFLDRAELTLDGPVSILIGPNGGGKTNLLDAIVVVLRRYIFASMYARHAPTPDQADRYEFHPNDVLNNMVLERHTSGEALRQFIEIELEVTKKDLENMVAIQTDAPKLIALAGKKYVNLTLNNSASWVLSDIHVGMKFVYRVVNGGLQHDGGLPPAHFLQYLQMFEMDSRLREEFELAPLATPLMYLPVNRAASGFQSLVELAGYNEFELKRSSDGALSRTGTQIVSLAIGRLAQKYRLLLEKDKGVARAEFHEDKNLKELTRLLGELGYEWSLESIHPLKNQYDIRLKKQGSSFFVGSASSGERELLTYLFAIFALNVRDALIIVDEPELHLHPKWQKTLLRLFGLLAQTTGNQFLLATHSPTFVSPESIQYVSRVFSKEQKSQIVRLNTPDLPEARHLFNIVNSQNNERLFFADEVVLVEGLSDRIFFEAVLDRHGRSDSSKNIIEIVSVGGKGFFEAYRKVLRACKIEHSLIADLDYLEEAGTTDIKKLFTIDASEIKRDVIDNVKSIDGTSLVMAIDTALQNGNWDHAKATWEYIKGRRVRLRPNLDAKEQASLKACIYAKRNEKVHILQKGALEDYLPMEHASKDLEKLIRFLGTSDFWAQIDGEAKSELTTIANTLMNV